MINLQQVDPSMDAVEEQLKELEKMIAETRKYCGIARQNAADGSNTMAEWSLTPIAQKVDEIRNCADAIEDALPMPY